MLNGATDLIYIFMQDSESNLELYASEIQLHDLSVRQGERLIIERQGKNV